MKIEFQTELTKINNRKLIYQKLFACIYLTVKFIILFTFEFDMRAPDISIFRNLILRSEIQP